MRPWFSFGVGACRSVCRWLPPRPSSTGSGVLRTRRVRSYCVRSRTYITHTSHISHNSPLVQVRHQHNTHFTHFTLTRHWFRCVGESAAQLQRGAGAGDVRLRPSPVRDPPPLRALWRQAQADVRVLIVIRGGVQRAFRFDDWDHSL